MTELTKQEQPTNERLKPGRKPIADKKIPVTIYRPKSEIQNLGGLPSVRNLINDLLNVKRQ